MPDPFRDDIAGAGVLPAAANPFRPGAGRIPPAFGGRLAPLLVAKDMVDRLAVPSDPVDQPILRGVRGVGKTALMAYAREHAAANGTVCLHVEADAGDDDLAATCATLTRDARRLTDNLPARVARRLAAIDVKGKVEFHPPSPGTARGNIEALLGDLVVLAAAHGVGLLLTVDEVHEAEDLLLRPLVRALHRHAQDRAPLGAMLSGLPGVADTLMAEGQTYTERLRTHDLGMLDGAGVAEALTRPFAEDAGMAVADDVVAHVVDDTGGYPYFVQLWGFRLWQVAASTDGLDAGDVDRAAPLAASDQDDFHRRRWTRVPSGRARDMVRALAARGGRAAIGGLADDLGLGSSSALSPARSELLRLGLVHAPSHGWIAFTVPHFDRWVVQRT